MYTIIQRLINYSGIVLLLVSGTGFAQTVSCPLTTNNDTTVCSGATVQLHATAGFSSYHWTPGTGLSDSTIANPVATVVDNVSYTVSGTITTGSGVNLLVNGDFSLGNVGFTSGLNFTSLYSPGDYYVAPTFFTTAYSTGDHSPSSDEMLMSVDGSPTLETLWESTVTGLVPGNTYSFSFWGTDGNVNTPQYEIHFIGNVTGDNIIATLPCVLGAPYPASYWLWSQYNAPVWNAGANTSVTVRVINTELNGYGNDFAVDDFMFESNTSSSCVGTDTVNLYVTPQPALPVVTDTSLCEYTVAAPVHAGGQNIMWYSTPGSSTGTATAPTPTTDTTGTGSYYVTQTVNGCVSDTATLNISVLPGKPVFVMDQAQPACSQKAITVGPANPAWQYVWMDGLTTSPRTAAGTGNYILTASNICGSATDSVALVFEDCHCYFYLPNAFTPNNNGTNDEFKALHDCVFSSYRMQIYNRWGELLFNTTDPYAGWNGQYHGQLVEQGVYVVHINYAAKVESGYDEPKSVIGSVTVVR